MTRQYDGVRPVVEGTLEGDTWTTTAVNYWEGPTYYSPLASRYLPNGGGAYNYLADGLGSTRQLMSNATHTITDTYVYDAFGTTVAATGTTDNPYRYVGRLGYRACGGEMMQLGARYYKAAVGLFLTPDPLKRLGVIKGKGLYVYTYGQPVLSSDPSGAAPVLTPTGFVTPAGCVFAITAGWKVGESEGNVESNRFRHCMVSCELAQSCGTAIATAAGLGKEIYDYIAGWWDPGHGGSAFQPSDFEDNATGRACPSNRDCVDQCMGNGITPDSPDAPPGPFYPYYPPSWHGGLW